MQHSEICFPHCWCSSDQINSLQKTSVQNPGEDKPPVGKPERKSRQKLAGGITASRIERRTVCTVCMAVCLTGGPGGPHAGRLYQTETRVAAMTRSARGQAAEPLQQPESEAVHGGQMTTEGPDISVQTPRVQPPGTRFGFPRLLPGAGETTRGVLVLLTQLPISKKPLLYRGR